MEKEKGFRLFDNYDDDGQLRLFDADYDDWDEDWEEEPIKEESRATEGTSAIEMTPVEKEVPAVDKKGKEEPATKTPVKAQPTPPPIVPQEEKYSGPEIRVRYCSTCGKLLFVKEDASGYSSECNHCEIKYFQKA